MSEPAEVYHDARDDGVIALTSEEIEACAEVLRRLFLEPVLGDPAPIDEES